MSKSCPADLAVAFASLDRRIHLITGGFTTPEIKELIREVGDLRVIAGMELGVSVCELPHAIKNRRPSEWGSELDTLQALASAAGSVIRQIEVLVPSEDEE